MSQFISTTKMKYALLNIFTFHYYLLSITIYFPLLFTFHYYLLSITIYFPLLFTFHYYLLSITIYFPLLFTFHYYLLSNTIYFPLLFTFHYYSLSTLAYGLRITGSLIVFAKHMIAYTPLFYRTALLSSTLFQRPSGQ